MKSVTVILGHYGSGKTNLALNTARDLRPKVDSLTVIDLDVVNPYFRSTDNASMLAELKIELLGPTFAASNLDTPSLQPGIDSKIRDASQSSPVILDVGGDPDGARALARFAPSLATVKDVQVWAVVNLARPDTKSLGQNIELLRQIETVANIKVSALVGNTHLTQFTTAQTILEQLPVLREIADCLELPVAFVTVPRALLKAVAEQIEFLPISDRPQLYPVDRIVRTAWE